MWNEICWDNLKVRLNVYEILVFMKLTRKLNLNTVRVKFILRNQQFEKINVIKLLSERIMIVSWN
jgi:hypothetical protein